MSAKVYAISDPHLGHPKMAIKRGFSSAEEHDKNFIDVWNSIVNKHDTVYVLGDITMEKKQYYSYLSMLKGYKKIILGNHDKPQHVRELLNYVNSVAGMFEYDGYVLTHCPIHESQLSRYKGNIHGHLHLEEINDVRYINVSAEYINYKPRLISEL